MSAVPEASCQHKCIGADWTITCEYCYQDAQILFLRISGFATFSSIQEDAIVIKGGKKLWIIALFHCLPNILTEQLNLITNSFFFLTQEEQGQSCKKWKAVNMCQWLPKPKG